MYDDYLGRLFDGDLLPGGLEIHDFFFCKERKAQRQLPLFFGIFYSTFLQTLPYRNAGPILRHLPAF
jgi:hypothetical protein